MPATKWGLRVKEEEREERHWTRIYKTFERFTNHTGLFGLTEFKGLSVKPVGDGYRFTVRASINGKRLVTFIDGDNLIQGYAAALDRLDSGDGKWYPDKYA